MCHRIWFGLRSKRSQQLLRHCLFLSTNLFILVCWNEARAHTPHSHLSFYTSYSSTMYLNLYRTFCCYIVVYGVHSTAITYTNETNRDLMDFKNLLTIFVIISNGFQCVVYSIWWPRPMWLEPCNGVWRMVCVRPPFSSVCHSVCVFSSFSFEFVDNIYRLTEWLMYISCNVLCERSYDVRAHAARLIQYLFQHGNH